MLGTQAANCGPSPPPPPLQAELGRSGIEMRERIDRALSDQERLPAMSLLPHLRRESDERDALLNGRCRHARLPG